MNITHIQTTAEELNLKPEQVEAAASLLADKATVPFIARYRKEATGSLDEVVITAIRDRLEQLKELDQRKETVLKSLTENGHLTPELDQKVQLAATLAILEDLYLPYRPKRRTRASVAREKGLEPLALLIFEQKGLVPETAAAQFLDPENGLESFEDALSGARDIIAEMINEDPQARDKIRHLFFTKSILHSRMASGKEAEGAKYKDYFEWQEPAASAPSHRILAMRRGEKEDILNLSITPPEEEAHKILTDLFVKGTGADSDQVGSASQDCYKRLLSRSMETEVRLATKERADTEAINVFAENIRELLLAAPLGAKRILGADPGYRTGCKLACIDRQGKFLHHATIFPHTSEKQKKAAATIIEEIYDRFEIEAVAVGNGTAGRETEMFIKGLNLSSDIPVILVSESGASVYSASKVAREEFPDLDLTIRGAISIGRRLMDPLSELVKIDPKSIGVGQYQHDVDQTALKQALDDMVVRCVNIVGVDLNQASVQLLSYVSGLGPQLAKNIVAYRDTTGPFKTREELHNVPRLGPKAFEQSAGFLRIRNGDNPLDASAVHPESYPVVAAMASDLSCSVSELITNNDIRKKIKISHYVTDRIGLPTLNDILAELAKPGRDPRQAYESFAFSDELESITDLQIGMKVPGLVTNVTAFGAFIDIGVHQDGLVHISELSDRFVKNPLDVVKVHQKVNVTIMDVDLSRNRISLSMKTTPGERTKPPPKPRPGKKRPQKVEKKKPAPFNNPFTEAFRK